MACTFQLLSQLANCLFVSPEVSLCPDKPSSGQAFSGKSPPLAPYGLFFHTLLPGQCLSGRGHVPSNVLGPSLALVGVLYIFVGSSTDRCGEDRRARLKLRSVSFNLGPGKCQEAETQAVTQGPRRCA